MSPTIELPLWCRPGRSGSFASARSTPSSVASSRRSRKCSSSTISPPRTPPPRGHVERQRQAAPRAMPARQRRRGAQPFAPARRREAGFEGDADPAGEPFEAGFRGDGGGGQQVRMRDAILERREHALEVGEEAREEVRARRPRPVDPDRFLVAAVLADGFADQPPGRGARLIRQQPSPARILDPNEGQRRICFRRLERRGEQGGRSPAGVERCSVRPGRCDRPARRELPPPRRARLRDRAAAGSARHSRSGSHRREARRCPARCGRRRTARRAPTGSARRGAALAPSRSGSARRTGHAARARASTAPGPGDSGSSDGARSHAARGT